MPSADAPPSGSPAPPPTTTRSPSPPGLPPTQDSPGHRASALTAIFASALTHTLRACSYDNFAACFPTPASRCPDSLRELWRQMVGKMETLAKSEFESILAERSVVPALNTLDRLIGEAGRRKDRAGPGAATPIPPHTLPPTAILNAHMQPHLTQAQSTLNARLQTTQSRNAALMERISDQRREIAGLVHGLEAVVGDLEGAVGVLGRETEQEGGRKAGGAEGLRSEIVAMESELGRSMTTTTTI